MTYIRVKPFLFAVLIFLALLPALASATPVRFEVNGQFNRPAAGAFAGTLGIDTALGTVTAVNIVFPGLAPFDILRVSIAQVGASWRLRVDNASRDVLSFFFTTPQTSGPLGSLVDFEGGVITSGTASGPGIHPNLTGFSGTITRAVIHVPEPAELGMFALGLMLIGLLVVLRRRVT